MDTLLWRWEGIHRLLMSSSRDRFLNCILISQKKIKWTGKGYPGRRVRYSCLYIRSSTDSAWLAAELGLPYAFAGHFAPDQMSMAFKIYRENYKPSDRFPKPYIIAATNIIAADTDEEAEYLSTTLYQAFVNLVGMTENQLSHL